MGELKIFSLLPQNGASVSSDELMKGFWQGKEEPYNARVSGMGTLRSLKKKMEYNDEGFIVASMRAGSSRMIVWLEKKKRNAIKKRA